MSAIPDAVKKLGMEAEEAWCHLQVLSVDERASFAGCLMEDIPINDETVTAFMHPMSDMVLINFWEHFGSLWGGEG